MTEADKKYRQGRSFKQREGHYQFLEFLGSVVIVLLFAFIMYNILIFIYELQIAVKALDKHLEDLEDL